MTIEPSILRQYGLGVDVSRRDPIGTFLLRLIKNITITSSPDDSPYLQHHPSNLIVTKPR
jgi:hypothetical protein